MMRYPYVLLAVLAVLYVALNCLIGDTLRRRRRQLEAARRQVRMYHVTLYGIPTLIDVEQLPTLRCEALRRDLLVAMEVERRRIELAPFKTPRAAGRIAPDGPLGGSATMVSRHRRSTES